MLQQLCGQSAALETHHVSSVLHDALRLAALHHRLRWQRAVAQQAGDRGVGGGGGGGSPLPLESVTGVVVDAHLEGEDPLLPLEEGDDGAPGGAMRGGGAQAGVLLQAGRYRRAAEALRPELQNLGLIAQVGAARGALPRRWGQAEMAACCCCVCAPVHTFSTFDSSTAEDSFLVRAAAFGCFVLPAARRVQCPCRSFNAFEPG